MTTTQSRPPEADTEDRTDAPPLTIVVLGMGYVGLTLAAALADAGHVVHGIDSNHHVVTSLRARRPHIHEPGLNAVFDELVGSRILPSQSLSPAAAATADAVVLAVSTPVDPDTHLPYLENLIDATHQVAATCRPGTLVIVRSTAPVGTTRTVVLPILRAAWGDDVLLCMAPERTIQGQALRELVDLPQVVGGIDERSLAAGVAVFERLSRAVVPVSSTEAAELVKLANNCHTDLIYGFGNEIALIAGQHGVDPLEVIHATNLDYPRPNLSKPGIVGGACLTKDPYHLLHGTDSPVPFLIGAARRLNEFVPLHVASTVVDLLRRTRGQVSGSRLGVLGWACKGSPPTDDMRGAAIDLMMPLFAAEGISVLGADPMVPPEVIADHGGLPVSRDELIRFSDGLLVVNDHPDYVGLDVVGIAGERPPRFVYDVWRVLDESALTGAGVHYSGLGYVAASSR